MKALKKMTSCNDLRKKICTGSSKTFLRYPGIPPQMKACKQACKQAPRCLLDGIHVGRVEGFLHFLTFLIFF